MSSSAASLENIRMMRGGCGGGISLACRGPRGAAQLGSQAPPAAPSPGRRAAGGPARGSARACARRDQGSGFQALRQERLAVEAQLAQPLEEVRTEHPRRSGSAAGCTAGHCRSTALAAGIAVEDRRRQALLAGELCPSSGSSLPRGPGGERPRPPGQEAAVEAACRQAAPGPRSAGRPAW